MIKQIKTNVTQSNDVMVDILHQQTGICTPYTEGTIIWGPEIGTSFLQKRRPILIVSGNKFIGTYGDIGNVYAVGLFSIMRSEFCIPILTAKNARNYNFSAAFQFSFINPEALLAISSSNILYYSTGIISAVDQDILSLVRDAISAKLSNKHINKVKKRIKQYQIEFMKAFQIEYFEIGNSVANGYHTRLLSDGTVVTLANDKSENKENPVICKIHGQLFNKNSQLVATMNNNAKDEDANCDINNNDNQEAITVYSDSEKFANTIKIPETFEIEPEPSSEPIIQVTSKKPVSDMKANDISSIELPEELLALLTGHLYITKLNDDNARKLLQLKAAFGLPAIASKLNMTYSSIYYKYRTIQKYAEGHNLL